MPFFVEPETPFTWRGFVVLRPRTHTNARSWQPARSRPHPVWGANLNTGPSSPSLLENEPVFTRPVAHQPIPEPTSLPSVPLVDAAPGRTPSYGPPLENLHEMRDPLPPRRALSPTPASGPDPAVVVSRP